MILSSRAYQWCLQLPLSFFAISGLAHGGFPHGGSRNSGARVVVEMVSRWRVLIVVIMMEGDHREQR
jgi:hypothetical protein